jgi:hypothetical protein
MHLSMEHGGQQPEEVSLRLVHTAERQQGAMSIQGYQYAASVEIMGLLKKSVRS